MKRLTCGLCVALGALTMAAGAAAKAPHHPATLFFHGDSTIDKTLFVVGHLTSPSAKCVPKRTVKVLYDYGDGFELVDVAKSSNNGFFAAAGPNEENSNGADRAKFTLLEKTFRKRGQRHICDGEKLVAGIVR